MAPRPITDALTVADLMHATRGMRRAGVELFSPEKSNAPALEPVNSFASVFAGTSGCFLLEALTLQSSVGARAALTFAAVKELEISAFALLRKRAT